MMHSYMRIEIFLCGEQKIILLPYIVASMSLIIYKSVHLGRSLMHVEVLIKC